jgi:hypothetical protein
MRKRYALEKPGFSNLTLYIALLLVIITPILMFMVYTRFLNLHIYVGPFYIHHWLSLTGTLFIALFTPYYVYAKRQNPLKLKTLLKIHVFGNLIAVMFVSIHFTQQISRPAQFYPDLGTGIVLYASLILLVLTGFLLRFRIAKTYGKTTRFLHASVTVAFYLIIVVHILHGLGII